MVLAGQALDEVRRELQREGADLKGAMWSLRGYARNLSEERQKSGGRTLFNQQLQRYLKMIPIDKPVSKEIEVDFSANEDLVAETP